MRRSDRTDLLVIGGGPAGLAAAIASRMAGFEVTLVEPKRPPIDKACGEGLMPDGVALMQRLGVSLPPDETYRFDGIEFIEDGVHARARFRHGQGLGARRTTLHAALARRAAQSGVRLLWGHSATVDAGGEARIDGEPFPVRWIAAADGVHSRVRRSVGLDAPARYKRFGLRRHHEMRPWSGSVQVYWSDRCEAYVTPVGPRAICLAMLIHDPSLRFDEALDLFPGLREKLDPASAERDETASGNVCRRLHAVTRGRVALVGDASGSVDALTGMGMTMSFHQAILLARSLTRGSLEPYAKDHRRLSRLARGMTLFMLGIDRRRLLRRAVMRSLSAAPWIFTSLLRLHTRDLPFTYKGGLVPRERGVPAGIPGESPHGVPTF